MMKPLILFSALALAPLSVLSAQDSTAAQPAPAPAPAPAVDNSIRPGMSEADVRSKWGDPVATKTINDWKYLFYRNYDERHVGFLDVVMLQGGQVVDAVIRSNEHSYAGQSSSPGNRQPEMTPPGRP
jgi:hypothetical protein